MVNTEPDPIAKGVDLTTAKARATEAAIKYNRTFVACQMPSWKYWNVYPQERGFPPGMTIGFIAQPPKTGLLF